ncbi:MAG: peptidoglycan DD-metalloendopeptidase family protein [Alicyclobacillaceae bacterium]|nr:peptidoglycan DD-metalloendopeptidase family protein [Alicyclobacillaceae bacterium]
MGDPTEKQSWWKEFLGECRSYIRQEWAALRIRLKEEPPGARWRRYWTPRTTAIAAVVVPLAVAGAALTQSQILHAPVAYLVYANGNYIGAVADPAVLDKLRSRSQGVRFEVRAVRMRIGPDQEQQLWRAWSMLPGVPKAYGIYVNGKPVVALATEEEAKATIDRVKALYAPEGVQVDRVVLREKVDFGPIDPSTDLVVRSVDDAVRILTKGTDVRRTYLVSRGDTLWTIAANHNMTVEQLQESNPQLSSPDMIREGDVLNLTAEEPYLHAEAVREVTREVPVPYGVQYRDDPSLPAGESRVVQEGREGRKSQAVRIYYVNGRAVREEVLEERLLEDKVDKVVARGTGPAAGYASGTWIWPTTSHVISSPFGEWRGRERHPGVDIGAPYGAPVYASNGGRVIFAGWDGGYGLCVRIDHGGGVVTVYGHLSQILVVPGQAVAQGQVIGRVGATGEATGPHLHYEVRVGGRVVDPMPYT